MEEIGELHDPPFLVKIPSNLGLPIQLNRKIARCMNCNESYDMPCRTRSKETVLWCYVKSLLRDIVRTGVGKRDLLPRKAANTAQDGETGGTCHRPRLLLDTKINTLRNSSALCFLSINQHTEVPGRNSLRQHVT